MNRCRRLGWSTRTLVLACLAALGQAGAVRSQPAPELARPIAALRVYVDPESGKIVSGREGRRRAFLPLSHGEAEGLRTDDEGLVVEKTWYGRRIDLRGRFRHAIVARRTASGGVDVACLERLRGAMEEVARDKGGER